MRTACLLLFLLLDACASDPRVAPISSSSSSSASSAKTDSGEAARPATQQAPEAFEGTLETTEKAAPLSLESATLQKVRTAPHPGFDRIVFEFEEGPLPGYRVEYLDETARQCGSGEEVRTEGGEQMVVHFETAQAHTEEGHPTVPEMDRRLGFHSLRQARLMCDFEGHVDWVLGVSTQKPYRVMELSEPARLIVDVRH